MMRFLPIRFAENRLRQGVVDLVRTGVKQVFALQINLRTTDMLRQSLGKIEFGRATGELLQMMPQLL
ncbi:MAG: hypothetical protein QM760_23210 [Nibricoccus sp.]